MTAELSETTPKTEFSLKRNEIEITLEGENSEINKYLIREMTGAQRDQYLKVAVSKASFGADGKVSSVRDPTGLQPALISLCMIDVATKKYVDAKFVNEMRTTVQNDIFEMCSKLNGLDKEADETSKKD
jgi:hypothetical protein